MIIDVVLTQVSTELPLTLLADDVFTVDFGEVSELAPANMPIYDGAYTVNPSFFAQTLGTTGLMMKEDLTVNQIPIAVVSNNSGGTTVIIGG